MFKKIIALFLVCAFFVSNLSTLVFAVSVSTHLTTGDSRYITKNSATLLGVAYSSKAGNEIEWGAAVSEISGDANPVKYKATVGNFSVEATSLKPNTKYYYRTYLRYYDEFDADKLVYDTNEKVFTTLSEPNPTPQATATPASSVINVPRITGLSTNEVLAETTFIPNGNTVKYVGFLYSEDNPTPTRNGSSVREVYDTANLSSQSYSKKLSNLSKSRNYYLRAYITVTNKDGMNSDVYSTVTTFSTTQTTTPQVTTDIISNINDTSVDVTIDVAYTGSVAIVERGVIYSTTAQLPELYNDFTKFKTISGTIGKATISLTNLEQYKKHYVRAYVRNANNQEFYGDVKTFETKSAATVITNDTTDTTLNSTTLSGSVTNISQFELIEKGFVFSKTSKTPTIDNDKLSASVRSTGEYSMSLTSLLENTTYYARAYARSSESITYGNVISFKTKGTNAYLTVTYRDKSQFNVSAENIISSVGETLTPVNLKVPEGYKVAEDWKYEVTKTSASTVVEVTPSKGANETVYVEGVGNMMFAPERAVTRGEVAQAIYNLANQPRVERGLAFTDVSSGHVFKAAIDYVSQAGIMTGDAGRSTFRPGDTIKRSEMCVVLAKMYKLTDDRRTYTFADVSSSDWFDKYVNLAYNGGMMSGMGSNKFSPNTTTTRAQLCSIFGRAEKRTLAPLGTTNFNDVPESYWAYKYIMNASIPK